MEQTLPKVKVMEVYWSHDDHQNQLVMHEAMMVYLTVNEDVKKESVSQKSKDHPIAVTLEIMTNRYPRRICQPL